MLVKKYIRCVTVTALVSTVSLRVSCYRDVTVQGHVQLVSTVQCKKNAGKKTLLAVVRWRQADCMVYSS